MIYFKGTVINLVFTYQN